MKIFKKLITGALAALSLVIVAATLATPAYATSYTHNGITCTQLSGSGLTPNIFNCSSKSVSQFQSGIAGTQANALTKLQPNSHFWEFDNIAAYQAFCNNPTGPSLPCSAIVGTAGQTVGTNSWIYTGAPDQVFPYGAAAGGHEEGHQLDLKYQSLLGLPASASAQYVAKVNKDWTYFNALGQCSNSSGAFWNLRDDHNRYICTGADGRGGALTALYTGLGSNKAILQKAWPYYFFAGDASHPQCTSGAWCELWAEEQKFNLGDNDNTIDFGSAVAFIYRGFFHCSATFQSYLFQSGTLKPNNTYPPECQ